MKVISNLIWFVIKIYRRLFMYLLMPLFKSHGRNFIFDPFGQYSFDTITVGNDVFIGPGATLSATNSGIIFGNKIMLGPNVTMMGGNHNTTQLGKYMFDVIEKLPENDMPIIIEDDVWIGAGATILKGVRISTGTIVAAGALVTRDTTPYSVVGGVPARVLKMRFVSEDLEVHKSRLGPLDSANLKS